MERQFFIYGNLTLHYYLFNSGVLFIYLMQGAELMYCSANIDKEKAKKDFLDMLSHDLRFTFFGKKIYKLINNI